MFGKVREMVRPAARVVGGIVGQARRCRDGLA